MDTAAYNATLEALNRETPDYKMTQTRLASGVNWARYSSRLGRFTDFLRSHNDVFGIDESGGLGNNVVFLRARQVAVPVEDADQDKIDRPVDQRDNLPKEKIQQINYHMRFVWRNGYVMSALYGAANASQIFNSAYFKCARMTIAVSHVIRHIEITKFSIRDAIIRAIPDLPESCILHFWVVDTGGYFLDVSVTITGRDECCKEVLKSLCYSLNAGRIRLLNKTLSLYQVVCRPVVEAVVVTIKDLIILPQNPNRILPVSVPTSPDRLRRAPPPPLIPPTPAPQPNPPRSAWPEEFVYEDLSKSICDLSAPSELTTYIGQATSAMLAKEALLRERCAELQGQTSDTKNKFVRGNGCEWIVKPEFLLGMGSEATMYMGLYSAPGEKSVLVAMKQSHDDTDPFNSQEGKHLLSFKRSPGIAQYHTSFTLEYGFISLSILALEIGLLSLRDLISGRKESNGNVINKPITLSTKQKFKSTKALCLAVNHLHTECSVVHRDLRPENVLLMRDGTLCITDFGLSRTAKVEGTLVYTTARKTVMQPFEVQVSYNDENRAQVPITHGGDVFMLGCVLAYIHQGRDPFEVDRDIVSKKAPRLDNCIEEQPWLSHLLRSMLNHDAKQRPPLTYILKHPYFLGHSAYCNLSRDIEFTVVMDFKPKDDYAFRALEAVLLPIEQKMSSETVKWHQQLHQQVPTLFDEFKFPTTSENRLVFVTDGGDAARDHPLPQLAQLLRWLRNVLNHFSEVVQDQLRRTKGANSCFETAGEFFTSHPAVCWLLPAIWTATFERIARIDEERSELIKENERRIEEFQQKEQDFVDQRALAARVLEWGN